MKKVNIRPGVSVLSVLRHLNYKPWFALAEFVDNSVQSYIYNSGPLMQADGKSTCLRVSIETSVTNGGSIIIRDNAAGVNLEAFPRAFRPAQVPPDRSGLSEFGMGMKSAACWFSPNWRVRTSALGEDVCRTVTFDIGKIVNDNIEELDIAEEPSRPDVHFTEIVICGLYNSLVGKTVWKIKKHLTDIYRVFIREQILSLEFNGEELTYEPPSILEAPYYKTPDDDSITWRKDIEFDFGQGLKATGFAAIRSKGSTSEAGFALFRRNRLIEGSWDEGYRPAAIFRKPNSFEYQRLFGEIHLEGFEVSHTKDGFKWDENEEPFLELLKEHLDSSEMPLLQQAREHRMHRDPKKLRAGAETAADRTSKAIESEAAPILQRLEEAPAPEPTPEQLQAATSDVVRTIKAHLHNVEWTIVLELTTDPAVTDWLELSDAVLKRAGEEPRCRKVGVRMALSHPFMERFSSDDSEDIEPILRLAAALALSEAAASSAGVRNANTVRRNVNDLLRNAFSRT